MKQVKRDETVTFEQMGIAAMLPGMQHMLSMMQSELDTMRARLGLIQGGLAESSNAPKKKLGRPPNKKPARVSAGRSGWPEDPVERSIEMKRRQAVAEQNKKVKKLHPRDEGHPDHEKFLAKVRKASKKRWEGLSFKERKARIAAMAEGKAKKKKPAAAKKVTPVVHLAEAS